MGAPLGAPAAIKEAAERTDSARVAEQRRRIVVIYDRSIRPDTTGVHCEQALRRLGHDVVHHPPVRVEGGRVQPSGYADLPSDADLYLQIDDDLGYPGPPRGAVPSVYWCIDTHRMTQLHPLGRADRWAKVAEVDVALCAQRDRARELGCPWLPLAFDPTVCHPLPGTATRYDWCFVGSTTDPGRYRWLATLLAAFPNAYVGAAYGAELNRVLNASRVAVNVPIANDVNMRVFEACGAGRPLLTRATHNGEDRLFRSLVLVDELHELVDRMALLLRDPDGAAELGARAAAEAAGRHTYERRMTELLDHVDATSAGAAPLDDVLGSDSRPNQELAA